MLELSSPQKAQRLRIYIGESDHWRGQALDTALLETLRAHGAAGATIFRGAAGFGAHSRIHTSNIEVLSVDLPVVIEVVDSAETLQTLLEIIYPMVREGLITLEDVQVLKYTHRWRSLLPADRRVSEVMSALVMSFPGDLTVWQAWQQMLERQLKAAPVTDSAGQVIGILTDEDLLQRAGIQQRMSVAARLDSTELEEQFRVLKNSPLRADDVMTHPALTILETESLGAATARMVKNHLKRMPVVDVNGHLVGMLSRLDILRAAAQHAQPPLPEALPSGAMQTVGEIMITPIPMVRQEDDLRMLIESFAHHNTHRLIVVDANGVAVGLISDSDVVARIPSQQRKSIIAALRQIGKPPPGTETAFDLMSPGPLTAPPNLSISEAMREMLAQSRKWLVVTDAQGKPLGLVDRQRLLEILAAV